METMSERKAYYAEYYRKWLKEKRDKAILAHYRKLKVFEEVNQKKIVFGITLKKLNGSRLSLRLLPTRPEKNLKVMKSI
jgi:hypothetical protein